ncbi:uncharacterized protein LOC128714835 [Anopheles marshallii]|uniref:uncharacterized protein LOC128714835 n=1 Tax=Anopheles marshallii TaxID=1521116 RepID=UPI00237AE790|nr:uncharacterized protein LOC128714835 [Anopheles marshallii]
MTTLCSPWNQGQRDEYPSKALANFLYTSNFSTKEMDDILVEECNNRNTVYVLNSSYRYGNMDMIELFGTPAGRALTVNNKTAAELHQNRRTVAGGSSGSSSTTDPHLCPSTIGGLLTGSLHSTNISSIKISGPDNISTAGQHHFIESSEFIRFASSSKATPSVTSIAFRNKCSSKSADISSSKTGPAHLDQPANRRNNLKMAKFWKLFDEDRLRKANSTERMGDKLRQRWIATPPLERAETVDKSANDLYSEAAQLLGIKCSLTDSCRCIDCQSQYFDCDDDADAYSEYSDKSYDMEDNLFTNRSYYNDLSTVPGVPDADTFGTTTISDRLNRNQASHNGTGWDTEGNGVPDDVNGNECEHYLHSTHNSSSLNLALDEGQLPANDRSQLPIDTSETERPNGSHQPVPAVPSDEECAGGIKVA